MNWKDKAAELDKLGRRYNALHPPESENAIKACFIVITQPWRFRSTATGKPVMRVRVNREKL